MDIRNGRSVVDNLSEISAVLATENYASGTSSKVVLNSAINQANNLVYTKNHDILAETMKQLLSRSDGLQFTSLY